MHAAMEQPQLKCFLAAFDFDYTIINDNSDTVVRQLLQNIPESLETIRENEGWTRYMEEIFKLLHENNVQESDIVEAVVSIPPVPNAVEMLRMLNIMNCEVIIISDSNTVFINEWLKAHDIVNCVNKVYSNPAEFKNGRLHIEGYHEQDWCRLSAKNMCKGFILFDYIKDREKEGTLFRYVTYCGDGSNDFCPAFRLRTEDTVFVRKFYSLDKLLLKNNKLKANIIRWEDTNVIVQTLQKLRLNINKH